MRTRGARFRVGQCSPIVPHVLGEFLSRLPTVWLLLEGASPNFGPLFHDLKTTPPISKRPQNDLFFDLLQNAHVAMRVAVACVTAMWCAKPSDDRLRTTVWWRRWYGTLKLCIDLSFFEASSLRKSLFSAPKLQRFLRFAIAMPIVDPKTRSDFRDTREQCCVAI